MSIKIGAIMDFSLPEIAGAGKVDASKRRPIAYVQVMASVHKNYDQPAFLCRDIRDGTPVVAFADDLKKC